MLHVTTISPSFNHDLKQKCGYCHWTQMYPSQSWTQMYPWWLHRSFACISNLVLGTKMRLLGMESQKMYLNHEPRLDTITSIGYIFMTIEFQCPKIAIFLPTIYEHVPIPR